MHSAFAADPIGEGGELMKEKFFIHEIFAPVKIFYLREGAKHCLTRFHHEPAQGDVVVKIGVLGGDGRCALESEENRGEK